MISIQSYSILIFFITRATIVENFAIGGLDTRHGGRNAYSAIAGGVIPFDDDYNHNSHNRLPYQNGGQYNNWNHRDQSSYPHRANNYYGKSHGGYSNNNYMDHDLLHPIRSAWDWLNDTLAYYFTDHSVKSYYSHNSYGREPLTRGHHHDHRMLRKRSQKV